MPWKCIGNILYVRKGDKWVKKATTKSPENCKKMMGRLYGLYPHKKESSE